MSQFKYGFLPQGIVLLIVLLFLQLLTLLGLYALSTSIAFQKMSEGYGPQDSSVLLVQH
ncbi:MAG: hypothetical protein K0S27_75 [Gammaproteobacteria bacterium]|jgi:Tfp pilus assembly protein PilX|nr:hypothetical protein [Gammaproteobacteria bacterium]